MIELKPAFDYTDAFAKYNGKVVHFRLTDGVTTTKTIIGRFHFEWKPRLMRIKWDLLVESDTKRIEEWVAIKPAILDTVQQISNPHPKQKVHSFDTKPDDNDFCFSIPDPIPRVVPTTN